MACREREDQVESLTRQLDRGDVSVVYDRLPASRDPEQRWANGRRAWLSHDRDTDWHVVIQDDAVVCEDFLAGLEKALTVVPTEVAVTAYVGRERPSPEAVQRRVNEAKKSGSSWVRLNFLYWGLAVAVPTPVIGRMVAWGDRMHKANYDTRLGRWLRDEARWPVWGTHPSLVEHRDESSLVGHDVPGRVAHHFHQGSALDVNWTLRPKTGAAA